MPKKRQFINPKDARRFQLVFRSQHDPLIHDQNASDRVLMEITPGNHRPKTRSDLEDELGPEGTNLRDNVGEAAMYGVYFDDMEYDYMQHLRPVGLAPDAVLVESPMVKKEKNKQKEMNGVEFKSNEDDLDLPSDVFASKVEIPLSYQNQQNIPEELQGFQPNMNPNLRDVLEALEDDEYVNNDLDDAFFAKLNQEGADYEEEEEEDEQGPNSGANEADWESRYRFFKAQRESRSDDEFSEEEKGTRMSAFSMSSSALFRNQNLTLLDQRFEKIEEEYEETDDDEDAEVEQDLQPDEKETAALEAAMNEFMEKYEVLGSKMKEKLVIDGDSADKLSAIREGVKLEKDEKKTKRMQQLEEEMDISDDEYDILIEEPENRWDCETILSTYSRFDNHPFLIKESNSTRIKINKKGMPELHDSSKDSVPSLVRVNTIQEVSDVDDEDEGESEEDIGKTDTSIGRSKLESKEEKKARKQAIKSAKQNRRLEKKATKSAFAAESLKQKLQPKHTQVIPL